MRRKVIIIGVIVVLIACVYLFKTGYVDLWMNGIGAVFHNTERYSNEESEVLKDSIKFEVDLADLESNKGIEIYSDGENKIVINEVGKHDSINSGGYYISFDATGPCTIKGATLVSPVESRHVSLDTSTSVLVSKLYSTYKGKQYECSLYGMTGYGTNVAFYLFPTNAYEDDGISLDETGTVELELVDLYKNVWKKIK